MDTFGCFFKTLAKQLCQAKNRPTFKSMTQEPCIQLKNIFMLSPLRNMSDLAKYTGLFTEIIVLTSFLHP